MATDIVEICRTQAAAYGAGGVASSLAVIFHDAADEIDRLRGTLRRIATEDYNADDQALTSPQPTMIWQLVAQHALEQ